MFLACGARVSCTSVPGLAGPQGEERVRLWLDNLLVIDQWTSLTSLNTTVALSLGEASTTPSIYDIWLEFKGVSNVSSPVPSSLSFKFAYHERPYASFSPSHEVPVPAVVTTLRPISSEYLLHSYPLAMRTSGGAGLSATYYSDSSSASSSLAATCAAATGYVPWGSPRKSVVDASLDWSSALDRPAPHADSVAGAGAFAVRWSGFLSPPAQAIYTFRARLHGDDCSLQRLSIWVDHEQIMSQWTSLTSITPSATARLDAGTLS